MSKIDFKKDVEIAYEADVAVIGGGIAGTAAAVAAAREGKSVLLVESSGCLGGLATNGHVSPFDATKDRKGRTFGGIAKEILDGMDEAQEKYGVPTSSIKREGPHLFKWVLLNLAVNSGVKILFHATLLDAIVENDTIKYALVATKSGIRGIKAKVFVDTTGDADLVNLSGEEFIIGSEASTDDILKATGYNKMHFESEEAEDYNAQANARNVQPVSIMFTMGNVDTSKNPGQYNNKLLKFEDLGTTKEEFFKLPYAGTVGFEDNGDLIPLPQGRILIGRTGRPGEMLVNMSRIVGVNAADADELTDAEVKAQLQVMYLVDFLKRFVPGFENSFLVESGNTLGVRETRRLVGRYVLSGLDAINCVHFDDDVACGSYMIDIHDPHGKRKALGGEITGTCYGIPYRSLTPKTIKNLLVAGRCISTDRQALASLRVMASCMGTGQAAGVAAAMAVANNQAVQDIDTAQLVATLKEWGAVL